MQGSCSGFARKRAGSGRAEACADNRPCMTYKISGLDPSQFAHLVGLSDDGTGARMARSA